MSFITNKVMPIAASGVGGQSYFIAEYDAGTTVYTGGTTSYKGQYYIAEDNSGNIGFWGVSNEFSQYESSDRMYFFNVNQTDGTAFNGKVWRPQASYLTGDVYCKNFQYDTIKGQWISLIEQGSWYKTDGNSSSTLAFYIRNDDGTAAYDFTSSSINGAMQYCRNIPTSGSVWHYAWSNGDTVWRHKYDPTGGTTGRVTQSYEAQDGVNWASQRGFAISPDQQRMIHINTKNNETSVTWHPASDSSSLSYYARKVPGSDQGSGYDVTMFQSYHNADVGFTGGANTYNAYVATKYGTRLNLLRINNSSTYYYCRLQGNSYNGFTVNPYENPTVMIAEATGNYVYSFISLPWQSYQRSALVILKHNKSDMSIDSSIAIACDRGQTSPYYNDVFKQSGANNSFALTQDEQTILIGGGTKDSTNWGDEISFVWRLPTDFSQINFGTYGNWYIWDFSSSTTGGTLPVMSELVTVTTGTSATYNRTNSISSSGAGNYYDDQNLSYYESDGQSQTFTASKQDVA